MFPWRCQDVDSASVKLDLWVFSTEEVFELGVSLVKDGEIGMGDDKKDGIDISLPLGIQNLSGEAMGLQSERD